MNWNNWIGNWEKTLTAIENIGGEATGLHISKPVTEEQVQSVEKKIGYTLPKCFRDVLLNFASSVDFGWNLEDAIELPNEFIGIFGSECVWNLKNLIEIEEDRKGWIESCFSNPDDEYDKVWHNKLAFMTVGNGDLIAFDLTQYPEYTPVVYLSHDDGEGHGCILGKNFKDFIDKWTQIGCPGPEEWQITPFLNSDLEGIDPNSENAIKWRSLIGLNVD